MVGQGRSWLNAYPESSSVYTTHLISCTRLDQTGYVILGVADTKSDAGKYEDLFGVTAIQYSGLFITGVDAEAKGDTDGFARRIVQEIEQEPISAEAKSEICRNMQTLNYHGHTVLVFSLQFDGKILSYDGVYYERHGSTLYQITAGSEEFDALLDRFTKFTAQQANSSVDKAASTSVKESHAF